MNPWRWLTNLRRRARLNREIEAELRFHLDEDAAERESAGLTPAEARRRARLEFGNPNVVREDTRAAWGWALVEDLWQDVRVGARALRRNPAFALTAILSLALGIGANTAIFSLINAVLLRALPVKDPQALVSLRISGKNFSPYFTNPMWEAIRDAGDTFAGMAAYSEPRFDISPGGESRYVQGLWVSGSFFETLGVAPLRGRLIDARDDRHGCGVDGPVAVVSHDYWQGTLQGDQHVVGRTITLNRQPFTIVGVTPAWMQGLNRGRTFDVAAPIGCEALMNPENSALGQRSTWWLRIIARLKPGAGLDETQRRVNVFAPEVFRSTVPGDYMPAAQQRYRNFGLALRTAANGFSDVAERYREALFALLGIAALVLLIACVNIANLMLARGAARQRELAMRRALGAGRARLVRQLLTESLLLALSGALGGLLLAQWGGRALLAWLSTSADPVTLDLTPDPTVLAFLAAVAVATALLFGLAPALHATRGGLHSSLREHGQGGVRARFRLGRGLVTAQIAAVFVLLLAAGLFAGSLRNALNEELGFRPSGVMLVRVGIPRTVAEPERRTAAYREVYERLRVLPGVTAAAYSELVPLGDGMWNQWSSAEDKTGLLYMNRVSSGYFQTMGTGFVGGRDFDLRDTPQSARVMIINESAAHYFFGRQSPLGRMIQVGNRRGDEPYQVVGVVRDSKYDRVDEKAPITAFAAMSQTPLLGGFVFELRHTIPAAALAQQVRATVAGQGADFTLEFRNLQTQVDDSLRQQRLTALLAATFGTLALALAMVGLYGVTAYSVAQRRGEIGLRIALGAQTRAVLWLVLRNVAVLLILGTVLGAVCAWGAGRLLASLLYGVTPNDPAPMIAAAATLAVATLAAAGVPAWRAARLDPMKVLREE